MDDLLIPYGCDTVVRGLLRMRGDWLRRWAGTWLLGEGKITWPLRDMASVPVLASRPVRRFTWRARQGHRPGLQFMVSTGRHHGFESLEEQRLLLALDFSGVVEVLPQPFELHFEHADGLGCHVPDFLAVMPGGGSWLFDVRPAKLIKLADAVKFAAAEEAATACGWRYSVVTGWRAHVLTSLDHLSSQRRSLQDRLGLEHELIEAVTAGPRTFADLVAATRWPVMARAHATHLLWHRRLGVDLGKPLGDGSLVWCTSRRGDV
ncbi:TnsA-like heteromeric transposase endonuclease subunit [Streptomyces antarcticus]|uniref:TnsA-like heteromeric transposase endonuclease subunit n=1 Tax=Streptomyces antarcticus TaxID=2996458 RepID=UPI002270F56F|nr:MULTISPECIES: TnsA-like heteromeric transposase endonuclease subunit [unclassified Streptomyces]MCY0942497.1 TnsA-like heteromeric transposase endonuclease subunit [Streptomyces sp. H34-AA3]MCZ4083812.1 TnsA-like heteromeric transposase endonuclease subunit [Streptomyces sp. H34-S5]